MIGRGAWLLSMTTMSLSGYMSKENKSMRVVDGGSVLMTEAMKENGNGSTGIPLIIFQVGMPPMQTIPIMIVYTKERMETVGVVRAVSPRKPLFVKSNLFHMLYIGSICLFGHTEKLMEQREETCFHNYFGEEV